MAFSVNCRVLFRTERGCQPLGRAPKVIPHYVFQSPWPGLTSFIPLSPGILQMPCAFLCDAASGPVPDSTQSVFRNSEIHGARIQKVAKSTALQR